MEQEEEQALLRALKIFMISCKNTNKSEDPHEELCTSCTSRYVPENCVTNHQLSEMMDTSDEWIHSRTGISERRIVTQKKIRLIYVIKSQNSYWKNLESKQVRLTLF